MSSAVSSDVIYTKSDTLKACMSDNEIPNIEKFKILLDMLDTYNKSPNNVLTNIMPQQAVNWAVDALIGGLHPKNKNLFENFLLLYQTLSNNSNIKCWQTESYHFNRSNYVFELNIQSNKHGAHCFYDNEDDNFIVLCVKGRSSYFEMTITKEHPAFNMLKDQLWDFYRDMLEKDGVYSLMLKFMRSVDKVVFQTPDTDNYIKIKVRNATVRLDRKPFSQYVASKQAATTDCPLFICELAEKIFVDHNVLFSIKGMPVKNLYASNFSDRTLVY